MLGTFATRRDLRFSETSTSPYLSRRANPGPAPKRLKVFPVLTLILVGVISGQILNLIHIPPIAPAPEQIIVQKFPYLPDVQTQSVSAPQPSPPIPASTLATQPIPQPKTQLPSGTLIIVDKTAFTLSLYEDGEKIKTYPVGLGKVQSQTPSGKFKVISRTENPVLYAEGDQPEIPGGDPKNPLGPRWMGLNTGLNKPNSIGIHGTSEGAGVGQPQTDGCVQLDNQIIRKVYDRVPLGTPVWIGTSDELKEWGVE